MNKVHILIFRICIFMASVALITACDDSAPGLPGAGGSAGGGGESGMGGDGGDGGGGMGGSTGMRCINDSRCADDEYCLIPEGDNVGNCAPGCREDNCEGDQVCDPEARICLDGPCSSDDSCDDGEYCNEGECEPGCRNPGELCDELSDGRRTMCDEDSRDCLALSACCMEEDMCMVESTPGECASIGGTPLGGAPDCSRNPCGIACETDEECGDGLDRFCNPVDDRCQDGCLPNVVGACPEAQTCNPETRLCEDLPCREDGDCPLSQFCDFGRGLCVDGCRDDAACPEGERCIDHLCQNFCDPTEEDPCGPGRYCDANNSCQNLCDEHVDCEADAFCDGDGHCVPGCRDDEGDGGEPNNTWVDAANIELSEEDDGVRFGRVEGRILCIGDPDIYRIDVGGAGSRIRVDVQFADGTPSVNLTGAGPQGNCSVCEEDENVERDAVSLEWACNEDNRCASPAQTTDGQGRNVTIEYPPINSVLAFETSYFLEVEPANDRVDYSVTVTVIDAATGCFPDLREADGGDDVRRDATQMAANGGEEDFVGTLCNDDQDWFQIPLSPNDGLSIDLISRDGTAIQAYVIPADGNLGDADITAGLQSGQYLRQRGENAFRGSDDWLIMVEATEAGTVAEYDLIVRHIPAGGLCGDDQGPPGDPTILDAPLDEVINVSETIEQELAICTADEVDVDMFCVQAGLADLLEAWVTTAEGEPSGKFQAQFVDADGVLTGRSARSTSGDDAEDRARVAGTDENQYCLRVEGVDGAQGDYNLFILRTNLGAEECALDLAEARGRNDRARNATPMNEIDEAGMSYEFQDGYICDPQRIDEDWYRFTVADPRSTVCVMIEGFDSETYDVDAGLYDPAGNEDGVACRQQTDCDEGGGGACIDGHCTAATASSARGYDFEMIHVTRSEIESLLDRDDNPGPEAGDFLVRVHHDDETEGPYQVTASMLPLNAECSNDPYEGNNQRADAAFLGAGQIGLCDAWLCDEVPGTRERDNDWYEIEVPQNEDRTVIITRPSARGTVHLELFAPDLPGELDSGMVESAYGAGNHQCINIRGGSADASVEFNVTGRPDLAGGNSSLSYSVRVVPTDLDTNPIGACAQLGALELDACSPWSDWEFIEALGIRLQPDNCWPVVNIP